MEPNLADAIKQLATHMDLMGALLQTMTDQSLSSCSPVQQSSSSEEDNVELEDESNDATASGEFLEGKRVVSPTRGTPNQKKL
ncbi:unnamed protein product [Linum trigynum]|uniref:Uncharacterized protein n=1 Tax=Linum trigynum TaxID=586398 RepID=A0AAV2FMQ7_9ROSI